LEQHSPDDALTQQRAILEGQLRDCYGRVVYSHKTHEKCADILLSRLGTIKLWQIILSSVTTVGFIVAVFGAGAISAGVGIGVSGVLLVLNAYTKNYDLGELAQKHRQAACDLWIIREKYLSLLVDFRIEGRDLEGVQKRRDELAEELHSIYNGAPNTTLKGYRKAQEALKKLEDMTFSDAEIDAFLPKGLRRGEAPR